MAAETADIPQPTTTAAPAAIPAAAPKPVPTPAAAPPKAAPPLPLSSKALQVALAAAPARTDAALAHLSRCLATPTGIDTVLLFVCYTARVAASGLAVAAPSRPLPALATRRLGALGALATEARMILRLWGLLDLYLAARRLVGKTRALNGRVSAADAVTYVQLAAGAAFQALENGAYLAGRGVLGGGTPAALKRAYRWSARFWAVMVACELGRLALEARRQQPSAKGKKAVVAAPESKTQADDAAQVLAWRKRVARNVAWAPVTLHLSTESGIINETAVSVLGVIPGIIQMRDLWRDTA